MLSVRRGVVVLALSAPLALSLPHGGPSAAAAEGVSVGPWVREVCRALERWSDASGAADEQVQGALAALESGDAGLTATKRSVVGGYERSMEASARLLDRVEDAGTPVIEDVEPAVSRHLRTLGEIHTVYRDAWRRYRRLRAANAKRFIARAEVIEAEVDEELEAIGMPLDDLLAHGELAPVIRSTARCASVIDRYLGLFVDVGDCVDASGAVSCADPHVGEVFFVGRHPAGPNDPFPGDAALEQHVVQTCVPEFERYVGVPVDQSTLDFSWYQPVAATWVQGDRQIVCTVTNADRSEMEGRVRGSAR